MDDSAVSSSLARKFDFLQERAQRKPIREDVLDSSSTLSSIKTKSGISHLKEFYLQRLTRNEPSVAARLAAGSPTRSPTRSKSPPSTSQTDSRKRLSGMKQVEDLEIMCTNCFKLLKASEASSSSHPCALGTCTPVVKRSLGTVELLDAKLQSLRAVLESQIQDNENLNVLRHLTALRYHIDTASKWAPGCAEIGPLSHHTLQQVKQLADTSRVLLAPAVYVFSKRIENMILQKERSLQKFASTPPERASLTKTSNSTPEEKAPLVAGIESSYKLGRDASVVGEMDSDCGTRYDETTVTQDMPSTDVGISKMPTSTFL